MVSSLLAVSTLSSKRDQQRTEKAMMDYCKSVEGCRRQQLFSNFDGAQAIKRCSCCDICAESCNCQ